MAKPKHHERNTTITNPFELREAMQEEVVEEPEQEEEKASHFSVTSSGPIDLPAKQSPKTTRIPYECLEHPEQATEVPHIEGQRKQPPICPCCGYQMIEVIGQKRFMRR